MASNAKAVEPTSAVTPDDEEWMDAAKPGFPKAENLAPIDPSKFGPGRLVAIWALENGSRKGDNGTYGYTETVTLVLDDGPNGDQTDDLIGAAPVRLQLQHSTGGIHARLKPRVDGKNSKGVRLKYRPMIGRMNTQPSKTNRMVAAFSIAEPTAEDMVIARKYKALVLEINAEIEAADKIADETAAFE